MGSPIWLGCIVPNTIYDQFRGGTLWVADKHVELYGIRIDAGNIGLIIHWYEHIPGISGSDMVYRLYFDNPPKVQSHTQI